MEARRIVSPWHPFLKKLLAIAGKPEVSPASSELTPPRDLVLRVLRQCGSGPDASSLLELMVRRGAALAAVVGLTMLAVQVSAGGPFGGFWNHALTHSAVLLRVFVP